MVSSKHKSKSHPHHTKSNEEVKSKKERREELKNSGGISKTLKNNLPIIFVAVILIVVLALVLNQGEGQSTGLGPDPNHEGPVVVMEQFHDPTCPFCIRQTEFNPNLISSYPYLQIIIHNINTQAGQEALQDALERVPGLASERIGTPVTVVGDEFLVGFGGPETTGVQMADLVEAEYQRLLASEGEN